MDRTASAAGRHARRTAGNSSTHRERRERKPNPLDPARLDELALAYAARFATSAGKLSAYLRRKIATRGWAGDEGAAPPDIDGVVERMVRAGYVDDEVFARARGSGLLRRGYGARRIDETLRAAGVAEDVRVEAGGSARDRREAALTMARKRGFGPFGKTMDEGMRLDPAIRQKQIAALLRAGHPLASARNLVNAASVRAAEDWVNNDDDQ